MAIRVASLVKNLHEVAWNTQSQYGKSPSEDQVGIERYRHDLFDGGGVFFSPVLRDNDTASGSNACDKEIEDKLDLSGKGNCGTGMPDRQSPASGHRSH